MEFPRQTALKEIGPAGHKKIRNSLITIIGVGSLGTWASLLLGSMGFGNIKIIDRDLVDESNLYHQPLFSQEDAGKPKASAASNKLEKMFPKTNWEAFDIDLNSENLNKIKADIILDCTDNLETRYLLNEYCVKNKLAWIHSAAIGISGNVAAFIPGNPCFKCLYPSASAQETCETRGIFNPVANMVASIQAAEAVKIITGKKPTLGLIRINEQEISKIIFAKNKQCSVCVKKKFGLLQKKPEKMLTFCGGNVYQTRIPIKSKIKNYQAKGPLTIFKDGRVLIKAESEKRAKSLLSRHFPL